MQLGLVTYQLASGWDADSIIANCEETGFTGVELRTTHVHGVEVELSPVQRQEVRQRFADSAVALAGLGSTFEYDSLDPVELQRNIDGTNECTQLAADVGALGVKVRPNCVHEEEGIPREQTFEQIGQALAECGNFARDLSFEIRLEVHGKVTCDPPNIRRIVDYAAYDNLFVCWNSNAADIVDGSIDGSFELLGNDIGRVHITELWNDYPWSRLFQLLKQAKYEGFCLAEIAESSDPVRLMRYYRALFLAHCAIAG